MAKPIYLEKNGEHFEYFVCNLPDDDKKTVSIKNAVVARKSFKNADSVECVSFEKCNKIEEFAFEDCKDLKSVLWQESKNESSEKSQETGSIKGVEISGLSTLIVQHAAFKNCSKLQTVILPKSTDKITIEKEAFAGCGSLRTVVFYGSWNVDISDDAFLGCSNITFLCIYGSSAERYAREHGFRIVNF